MPIKAFWQHKFDIKSLFNREIVDFNGVLDIVSIDLNLILWIFVATDFCALFKKVRKKLQRQRLFEQC